MGRIQASTGLVTGIDIQGTVDKLIEISARTRDTYVSRTERLSKEQVAVNTLMAKMLAVQLAGNNLKKTANYQTKTAVSSAPTLLSASITGSPANGNYQFTPIRLAQTQQSLSSGFASRTESIGAGTLTLRRGGSVDQGVSLSQLNGGAGVARGRIRITDQSGASEIIDLRYAQTIDDVLDAVNNATTIAVRAEVTGDRIRLVDQTGGTGRLKVQQVGTDRTAIDLGLAGIDVGTGEEALGTDIFYSAGGTKLSDLKDGAGIALSKTLADLSVTFRDGTSLDVDFRRMGQGRQQATAVTDASNGADAQIRVTAQEIGGEYDDVTIRFFHDPTIQRGQERVAYYDTDPDNKILTFYINQGVSTANDAIAALGRDAAVSEKFSAEAVGTGLGKVTTADHAVTSGGLSRSQAITDSLNGVHAEVVFTAAESGEAFDGVSIVYESNPSITRGNETVLYDAQAKTLTFQIAADATTAGDIIDCLNGDAAASPYFTADTVEGGDGTGLVLPSDCLGLQTSGGEVIEPRDEQTLGELLQTLNEADPTRLRAELSSDGSRLVLTDLTTDDGNPATELKVESFAAGGGHAAEDLGLTGESVDGVITGRRLQGGLKTTLLDSLGGGNGLGELGQIELIDRGGGTAVVDLSSAETLEQVIDLINAAEVDITASVNASGGGIRLTDTSAEIAGNLIVRSVGAIDDTAERLGIAADTASATIAGSDLQKQTVSESTRLDALNGGSGVSRGSFIIIDSNGVSGTVNLALDGFDTVGDVLDAINGLGCDVLARINDTGDGILIEDQAGGARTLQVRETSSLGRAARDLNLLGEVETVEGKQTIDGGFDLSIEIGEDDTLETLVEKINDLGAGVTAGIFNDGSGTSPYRLSLTSDRSGQAGRFTFDTGGIDFQIDEIVAASDAMILFGVAGSAGISVASSTNTFEDLIDGMDVTIGGVSDSPVTVTVGTTDSTLLANAKLFVDQYNALREQIDGLSAYNETDQTVGVLHGSSETLQISNNLAELITRRYFGLGKFQSLQDLGFDLDKEGTMTLDSAKLAERFAQAPEDVEKFFTEATTGMADRLDALCDRFVAEDNSMLMNRSMTLQRKIERNEDKIAFLEERLEAERERLLLQFYNMELAIGKWKDNLGVLDQIQAIEPLALARRQ